MKGTLGYKVRTITCAACGQTVTGHFRPAQRYCSPACYQHSPKPARKTGSTHACEQCGATFYAPAHRTAARFCSDACQIAWQGRNKTEHTCKVCGKAFRWSPSRHKANNITYCSLACRDADPARHDALIAMNARQQGLSPNKVEQRGYALLDTLGVPYERQHVVGGKFCVDAFVPDAGLVIQFDGDYWHGNPTHFPAPDARQRKRMALDQSQDAYMRACGYRVLRVWASELETLPARAAALLAHD